MMGIVTQAQESLNMTLLSNLDYSNDLSDIWGYATTDGEYALVGVYNGISVVNVSNPATPTELEFFPGPGSIWRDLKTWGDYLYCINESGAGLQIVNLSEVISGIPNPTYIENTSLGFTTAHNIFIDENGVLYVFGANYGAGGAAMYDLNSNPENPTFLGMFDDYYFHDGMVRGDTLWGGAIYNGVFSAIDVSDKANPLIIGSHSTPNTFSHNCWISDDGAHLFTTDEVSGAYVAAYDVSDLDDIQEVDRIQAWSGFSDVIPHNTHVAGDFIVTSYYTDGVSVVDISNPSNLIEVGFYDTSAGFSGNGFNGAWGTYPWLPSGNILVTDIETGLYVVEPKYGNASYVDGTVVNSLTGFPISNVQVQIVGSSNPAHTSLSGFYETGMADYGTYQISFSAPGYEDLIQSITITSGEILNFDVQLDPFATYQAQLNVINSANFDGVANASVSIYNDDFNYQLVSASNGVVTTSLIDGEYSISIGAWGYQTICGELVVSGEEVDQTFELDVVYSDDFSVDLGWQVISDASLSAGEWERGSPNGTYYQGSQLNPGYDAAGDCGSFAFVTGNTEGVEYYADDVDNGRTRIISPTMDLRFHTNPILNCRTWFRNTGGEGTPNDSLLLKLSNGIETILLDYRTYESSSSTWKNHEISLSGSIEFTDDMHLIVETMDLDGSGHLVEAGFDKFMISADNLSLIPSETPNLSIYPNPSSLGFLFFEANSDDVDLTISDLSGRLIETFILESGINSLNMSHLVAGSYIIELQSFNGKKTSLWVIE